MAENTAKHKHFNLVRHPPQQNLGEGEPQIHNPEVSSTTATGGRTTEGTSKPTLSDSCGLERGSGQPESTPLSHEQDQRFGLDKGQPVPLHSRETQKDQRAFADNLPSASQPLGDSRWERGSGLPETTPLNLSHEQDQRFGMDKGQPVPIHSHETSSTSKPKRGDSRWERGSGQPETTPLNLSHEQDQRFGLDKGQSVPIHSHETQKEQRPFADNLSSTSKPTHVHSHEKEHKRDVDAGGKSAQPGVGFIPEKDRPHLNLSGEKIGEPTSDEVLAEKRMRNLNLNEPAVIPVTGKTATQRPVQRTQAPYTAHTLQPGVAEPSTASMGEGRHESTYVQPANVSYAKTEIDGMAPLRREKGMSAVEHKEATWENPKTRDARMADQTIDRSQDYAKQT